MQYTPATQSQHETSRSLVCTNETAMFVSEKNPFHPIALPLVREGRDFGMHHRKDKFKPRPNAKQIREAKERQIQRDKREDLFKRHRPLLQSSSEPVTIDNDFNNVEGQIGEHDFNYCKGRLGDY